MKDSIGHLRARVTIPISDMLPQKEKSTPVRQPSARVIMPLFVILPVSSRLIYDSNGQFKPIPTEQVSVKLSQLLRSMFTNAEHFIEIGKGNTGFIKPLGIPVPMGFIVGNKEYS